MLFLNNNIFHAVLIPITYCLLIFQNGMTQEPINLDEALRLAKANNLQLKKQAENEKVARLQELVQRAFRLPSLDLTLSSSYLSEINEIDLSKTVGIPGRSVQLGGHDRSEFILGVRQPVFTGFRLQAQSDLAKNATLSESTKLEALANEMYYQTHVLFYKAQSLYNQKKILAASMKRLNVQLNNIRNLFEAAQAMAFDTLHVYNQTITVKIEQQKNDLEIRLTNLQMSRILDLTDVRPISEIELNQPGSESGNLGELKHQAIAKRAELKGAQIAQRVVVIQQKLFRSNYYPTIFGSANFHYAKPGLDPVSNEWMNYFSVGLNMQWNLWRWQGDQKKVEEYQVLQNRLLLEERELLRTIDYQVEESYENLQFSLNEWQLTEELQIQQTERYRIVSVQHQNDIASTNDLVTAEADLTRAELQTQLALIRYYINLAGLKRAVGVIGENVKDF